MNKIVLILVGDEKGIITQEEVLEMVNEKLISKSARWRNKVREGGKHEKYLVAILCGLIFIVAIGWAADLLDRYKE